MWVGGWIQTILEKVQLRLLLSRPCQLITRAKIKIVFSILKALVTSNCITVNIFYSKCYNAGVVRVSVVRKGRRKASVSNFLTINNLWCPPRWKVLKSSPAQNREFSRWLSKVWTINQSWIILSPAARQLYIIESVM